MKITRSTLRRMIAECMSDEMDVHMSDMDAETEMYGPAEHDGRSMGRGGDAGMARGQLFRTAQKAQSLFDRLSDEDTLPEWVQYKIAMAHEYMSTAEEYLSYTMARHDMGDPLPAYESRNLLGRYLLEQEQQEKEDPAAVQKMVDYFKEKIIPLMARHKLMMKGIDTTPEFKGIVDAFAEYINSLNNNSLTPAEVVGGAKLSQQ